MSKVAMELVITAEAEVTHADGTKDTKESE
jgi:hypothetical protein